MGNLRVLDIFSGIGGMSLGLSWAGGFETVAFCEIEPFCQRVLRKHWPDVPIYDDIRTLTYERLRADGVGPIDVITGGFPCQPASLAGQRQGTADDRWLWPEMVRLIEEVRPTWVIGENVFGFVNLVEFDCELAMDSEGAAIGEVGDLAYRMGRGIANEAVATLEEIGYEVQPLLIPACGVDAPHERYRIWLVAHHDGAKWRAKHTAKCGNQRRADTDCVQGRQEVPGRPGWSGTDGAIPDVSSPRLAQRACQRSDNGKQCKAALGDSCPSGEKTVSDDANWGRLHSQPEELREHPQPTWQAGRCDCVGRTSASGLAQCEMVRVVHGLPPGLAGRGLDTPAVWGPEPDIPRVASGIPNRVHKLRALGNAVVPQIPMVLGRMIIAAMQEGSGK